MLVPGVVQSAQYDLCQCGVAGGKGTYYIDITIIPYCHPSQGPGKIRWDLGGLIRKYCSFIFFSIAKHNTFINKSLMIEEKKVFSNKLD